MDWLDLLADPAYRHMLLNHLPIVGLALALLVLLLGLASRQAALLFTGLGLVALTAGASWPVATHGDAAYPAIYDGLDGHGRAWLDYHAHVAETWLPLLYACTGLSLMAVLTGILKRGLLPWAALVVLIVGSASLASTVAIGKAGGQIKHPEFRLTDPPVIDS